MSKRAESNPTTSQSYRRSLRRQDTGPKPSRPWLLSALVLGCIGLVIAGSIGPWLYMEMGPARAIETRTISGVSTDGVFSLFFAVLALIALLFALLRPDLWVLGVGVLVGLVLCTLVGLFDWVIFDPMSLTARTTQRPDVVRVEWGLKLLTIASLTGVVCSFLFARQLLRGDY